MSDNERCDLLFVQLYAADVPVLVGFFLTGFLCKRLLHLFALSDSRDAGSISLDSSDEDRLEQRPKGAVTSVDEALMKVTGAAEEDFLKQNFETLNQSCSTGTRSINTTNFKEYV